MFCGEHGPIEITGLWVQSGNSLYPVLDTVNIGIGTQNPLSRLHLKGDATTQANLYVETGRIGIGVNPETSSYKLDVQGNTNIQGNANISGNAKIEGDAQVNTLTFSQGLDVGVLQVYYGGDNKFYANTQSFYAN